MRFAVLLVIIPALSGCSSIYKNKVTVPPLLTPAVEADTARLIEEVNRMAAVRSIRGKIDIQFLDTSFAECGVAERYRTADGDVTLQRPGHVYLVIAAPFIGQKIAEMASDNQRFCVAVFQGDEKYRRFVCGTNSATYPRLGAGQLEEGGAGAAPPPGDCGDGDKQKAANMRRAVSSLSGLRPQHFTDALLIPPAAPPGSGLIYAHAETFEEEPDPRPRAKKSARIVRPYYMMVELAPKGEGSARVMRRFWFDRVGQLRLARLQNYDERGQLVTDVIYKEPKSFGEEGRYTLPSLVELTRPQDRYSLRITYQSAEAVKINQLFENDVFVLQNKLQLPEVNLDARKN